MKNFGLVAITGLLLATGASAAPKADNADKGDPNRMICRAQETTGSRVKAAKVCMTAQQWIDQRLADRQAAEKIQAGRFKNQ